ncbi:MAG: polyphosphate polymerase domain-containing protein [Clostridia bacterium]|nr:polyphosphate polymerase domain-containing protein [Clostridia bacterium]
MADIFRRVEKKYILTKNQFEALKGLMTERMIEDEHGVSTICNVYYDSRLYELISHSITKPFFKEKIRLRSYNKPSKDSSVFLEIKRKCDSVVSKRRIEMKLSDLELYVKDKDSLESSNKQIKKELDYYFDKYDLRPTMYLSYLREAYYDPNDRDFRVTFDSNVIAREYDLNLDSLNYGINILEKDKYIMEIKTLGSIPLWFVKMINELGIMPCGFSKYGEAYTQLILKANTCEECVV